MSLVFPHYIRRVRRKLVVEESEPDKPLPTPVVSNVEPVKADAEILKAETLKTEPAEAGTTSEGDAEAAP
ncbi:MAG: hypothetical protein RLY20_2238 [Verrucomicrobiota bacterium]|jgi:hypothetical protein